MHTNRICIAYTIRYSVYTKCEERAMFKVIKYEGKARRGKFQCAHGGEVQTPVFMNVGTQAAIKGGVSALDLKYLGCQIELSNTYHLHLRPGDDVVRQMGGLHKFMHWDGPILTDSGIKTSPNICCWLLISKMKCSCCFPAGNIWWHNP